MAFLEVRPFALRTERGVLRYAPEGGLLSFEEGECARLLGPNGTGKSLLLSALAGLLEEDERFPPEALSLPSGLRSGILFQDQTLNLLAVSVQGELELCNASEEDRREAVIRFNLEPFLERKIQTLSSGQKQRLSLASLWLRRPQLVFLDEPLSHLDSKAREALLPLLFDIRSQSKLWIHAEHPTGFNLPLEARMRSVHLAPEYTDTDCLVRLLSSPPVAEDSPLPVLPPIPLGEKLLSFSDLSFRHPGEAPLFLEAKGELRCGEIALLSGPNGVGKSTLLHLLKGILTPPTGRILRPLCPLKLLHSRAAYHLFLPSAAACLKGELHRLPRETPPQARPLKLSGGQQRALAFASLVEPRSCVYLLDEPGVGLDGPSFAQFLDAIYTLAAAGSAFILASHDPRFTRLPHTSWALNQNRLEIAP